MLLTKKKSHGTLILYNAAFTIMDDDDFITTTLTNTRNARRTYLVTYSQADLVKFPDRKHFGDAACTQFN